MVRVPAHEVGAVAVLCNLQTATELNGQTCVVEELITQGEDVVRYVVKTPTRKLSVQACKLRPITFASRCAQLAQAPRFVIDGIEWLAYKQSESSAASW